MSLREVDKMNTYIVEAHDILNERFYTLEIQGESVTEVMNTFKRHYNTNLNTIVSVRDKRKCQKTWRQIIRELNYMFYGDVRGCVALLPTEDFVRYTIDQDGVISKVIKG